MNKEWISVKDRLPEIDQQVLIYAPKDAEYSICIAMRTHQKNVDLGGMPWFYPENSGWWDDEVTHWMPLPDAPREIE